VEREARAAALRAEAEVLEAAGHRGIAARLRTYAEGVRTGSRGADADVSAAPAAPSAPGAARPRVELHADKISVEDEQRAFLVKEAKRLYKKMDELARIADKNGGKLTREAREYLEGELAAEKAVLDELAGEINESYATLLWKGKPLRKPSAEASAVADKILAALDAGKDIDITVGSKAEAQAILEALLAKRRLVEVTGFNAAIGRTLFPKGGSFHWDIKPTTVKAPNGRYVIEGHGGNLGDPGGLHHATTPHLQIQLSNKVQVRIFMPSEGLW
jgi:hypothetical protein